MNLIELKWNGFLRPFAFKFERHKKTRVGVGEGVKIHTYAQLETFGRVEKCEKKGEDEGVALNL
jgi:hypothetical protein